ncbi:3-phenylpropionate/cinnamic acid dioxygenase subunit beta [Mycolicibacterium holsaticum]|uniref:3-phenylpropionate/cinnamic acid dioxygenase subunit beta n=1 Tax=Mycolicibacterium holsaticum TaxID=152142 RepID=UPI001C7D7A84|nr:3-phenylpropionate/cinnamic acid dioxygenase subunit beta [Mycolicibacterium holsaticum]MDA4109388.1 benzene 1,2-dioxygenase [Mycolicibacterium holsaticum DSM 44478 = JCM 12374]QZA11766.1 3-phenylpropionate/cinnamic acid dioxygenase subunit beta [Mycolicibacterium holsaticum DSM 44478 = JCM 12374]UNC10746.1 3-phenylpropionate/cinnamic acid dioxygenase subunit beta [Mycolicibacterium holsaticum DSM 44478 = JCM 12374]
MTSTHATMTTVDYATKDAIRDFLYYEAELLDDLRFGEWLGILDESIMYWAPVRTNRTFRDREFEWQEFGTSAYFEETHEFLEQRVRRLETHMAWAEEPASRTRHLITNVRVAAEANPGSYRVKSNFLVYRSRGERDQDVITGERRDVLVKADDCPAGFRLKHREIRFDMSTILVKNLSSFY